MNFPFLIPMDTHVRELVRGTSLAFAYRIFGMAAGFALSVMLARVLGAHALGVFAISGTCAMIGGVVGRLGLDRAMLRFAAAGAHTQNWGEISAVYRKGMAIAVAVSGAVTIFLLVAAPAISIHVFADQDIILPLRIMALTIIPAGLAALHAQMLKALKLTGLANLVEASAPPIINLVVLGSAIAAIERGLDAADAAWVSFTSAVLLLATVVWLWRRSTPQIRGVGGSFDTGRLLQTSFPLFWVAVLNLVMGATDTVMLGIWRTSEQVALYTVGAKLAVLVSFPLIAVNSIAGPKIAGLHAGGEKPELERVVRMATLICVTSALPIFGVLILRPDLGLVVFGQEFLSAASVVMALSFGHFVNVATGPTGNLLMLTGYQKLMRNNIACAAVMNVILNLVLIPRFGILGAAAATALSMASMNLLSTFLVYRKLNICSIWLPSRLTGK